MRLLITGATGFIGKHVTRTALAEGHQVRASVRDPAREGELRAAVGDGPLEVVTLDLMSDVGWAAAMEGIDGLLHTASPVPVNQPQNPDEIIRPALEGTRRAVGAAASAGVPRVVVTSSIAAILSGSDRGDAQVFGAGDWTDPEGAGVGAYPASKTLAERAAREIAAATPAMSLATVNPGFVFGAPLDRTWASSLVLIDRLLKGTDPLLPRLSFPSVAVQDVAEAHLRALDMADGTRIVAVARTLWMTEIAAIIRAEVPGARTARFGAPDWLVKAMARFNPQLARFVSTLGSFKRLDNSTLTQALGRPPIPPEDAIAEAARAIAAQRR
jgi:dihydroflavonol-4-reductase